MKRTLAIVCGGLLLAANSFGFLFVNGSFDDPIDFEGGETWHRFGDPNGPDAVGWHDAANGSPGNPSYSQDGDGNYGLAFQTENASSGGFYQDVLVEAGRSYDFSIESHHGCNSFGTNGTHVSEIVFAWYLGDPDAGGILVSATTNDVTPNAPGGCDGEFPSAEFASDWNTWSFTGVVAPPGSDALRVTVQWDNQGLAEGGSAWVRWDNASLTTAVDPVNLSLDPTDELLMLSFTAQTTLTYFAESTVDFQDWTPGLLTTIAGDGAVHHLYHLPDESIRAWRLVGRQFSGLVNGDFNATNETGGVLGWTTWTVGSGWANHEIPPVLADGTQVNSLGQELYGIYDGTLQITVGGFGGDAAGAYQLVPATPGHTYNLDVEAGVEDWWLPIGEIRMIFLDAAENELASAITNTTESIHDPDLYDVGVPYQLWNLSATAPPDSVWLKVEFADPVGTGSCFFDNAVLTDLDLPGPLPTPVPAEMDLGQTSTVLISFDGQRGVRYQLEYSEDGGATWEASRLPLVLGTGTRMSVADPDGPSASRIYRVTPVL